MLLGVFRGGLFDREIKTACRLCHLHPVGQFVILALGSSFYNRGRKSFQAISFVPHLIQTALPTPILVPILFSPLRVKKNSL